MQQPLESEIIEAIPELAGRRAGYWGFTPLAGITNRSYRVTGGKDSYVLRIAGPSTGYLDRAAEAHNARIASALGIAPPVIHADGRLLLTRYLAGSRPLEVADLADPRRLDQVAEVLWRLQQSPEPFLGARHPFGEIDKYLAAHPQARALALRRQAEPLAAALATAPLSLVPAHVDATAANFLICADETLRLLDWEFSAMTDPCWDIASVLTQLPIDEAVTRHFAGKVLGRADGAILARVALFRTAMLLVAGSWCAMEAALRNDPALERMAESYLDRFAAALADPQLPQWISGH